MQERNPYSVIVAILLLFPFLSYGQDISSYTIKGQVHDSVTKQPIPFTQVAVWSNNVAGPLAGTLTDTLGRFELAVKDSGRYRIGVSFLGYESYQKELIVDLGSIDLGKILLTSSSQNLEEVSVMAERKPMAKENGNWVLYPDKLPGDGTGNTIDLLNTLPSVSVDIDDQISIRGRKVSILIDGIKADDPNPLDHISPSSIAKIEVITNPSAKYDSDGSIISIQLKKPIQSRTYTKLQSWIDTQGSYQQNLYANRKNKKWGGFVQFLNKSQKSNGHLVSRRNNHISQQTPQIIQNKDLDDKKRQTQLRLGINHYLAKGHLLKMDMNVQRFKQQPESYVFKEKINAQGQQYQYTQQNLGGMRDRDAVTTRFSYSGNWKDQKISVLGSIKKQDQGNNSFNNYQNFHSSGEPTTINPNSRRDTNNIDQWVYKLKADYEKSYSDRFKLETGVEWQLILSQQDLEQNKFSNDHNSWLTVEGRSFNYKYRKDGAAFYGIANMNLDKWNASLGCRLRYIELSTDNNRSGVRESQSRNYLTLLPSFQLVREWEQLQLLISYSKSEKLPSMSRLNAHRNDTNPLDVYFGNPNLKPESDHSLNIELSRQSAKWQMGIAAYGNYMRDIVFSHISSVGDTLFRTYKNMGAGSIMGAELTCSFKIKTWMRVNGSFNTCYQKYSGDPLPLPQNDIWSYNYKVTTLFKLKGNTQLQCNYNFQSESLSCYGLKGKLYGVDAVVSKKCLKKRLQISLKGANLLDSRRQNSQVANLKFNSWSQRYYNNRRFIVSLIYKLSKRNDG